MAIAPPTSRRQARVGRLVFRLVLLAALVGLTCWNAGRSPGLNEAAQAEIKGDYPAALKGATAHLARRPWSFEAHRIAARCLSRLDFAEEAEEHYRRGWPLSLSDRLYRAYGLTRANARIRALDAFDEILRVDPDDLATLRLKAGLLISMTRWSDLVRIGQRLGASTRTSAEADAPVTVLGHWTLRPMIIPKVSALGATLEAIAYHNQGEVEDAVASYRKVLELDPGLATMPLDRRLFWSQFTNDLLSIGRADEVIRRLSSVDPRRDDPTLASLQGRAYLQEGLLDEAEACWRRVLQLAPDHPPSLLNLGRVELNRGRLDLAEPLLAKAARLAPESYDAAYSLGLTYRRLGQAARAAPWEQQAGRLRTLRDVKPQAPSPVVPERSTTGVRTTPSAS